MRELRAEKSLDATAGAVVNTDKLSTPTCDSLSHELESNLTPLDVDELRALFNKLDADHNGRVSLDEWNNLVKNNSDLLARAFVGGTVTCMEFSRIDADHSGVISWEEVLNAAKGEAGGKLITAERKFFGIAELRTLFDGMDKDGDEKVTIREWIQMLVTRPELLQAFYGGDDLGQVAERFNEIDIDHSLSISWYGCA